MLGKLVDLLYPPSPYCSICGEHYTKWDQPPVCRYCWEEVIKIREPVCRICGKPLGLTHKGTICTQCQRHTYHFKKNCALGAYDGALREILHLLKYKNKKQLAVPLGELLAERVTEQPWSTAVQAIIPVPLHWQRYGQRGYNQAALLAQEIGRLLHITVCEDVLYRYKRTRPQSKVIHDQRFQNVRNAFRVKNKQKVFQKTLLLVDDIYTTGMTLNECAGVLKAAGSDSIYSATVAIGC